MKKSICIAFAALLTVGAFAQKSNISDAILRYRKYNLMGASYEDNLKFLTEAKSFIDLANVNSETSSSTYMHYYRGQIYYSLMELMAASSFMKGAKVDEKQAAEYEAIVKASFDVVLNTPKAKEKKDVEDFIDSKANQGFEMGMFFFKKKDFTNATYSFMSCYEISKKFANKPNEDARVNVTTSMLKAVDTLLSTNKLDEAYVLNEMVFNAMPKDIDVIISLINLNLKKNDVLNTEKYLKEAILLDSTNVQLYAFLGGTYYDMGKVDKSVEAYKKCIKMDPNYTQAIFEYCSILFNQGRDVIVELNKKGLESDDPEYSLYLQKSFAFFDEILSYIDPLLAKVPNDKLALEIAWKTYSMKGDEEKSNKLKETLNSIH
ncbi:MAG: tetratricopeptide repeat protein [Flavobacteriales bacterium]